MPVSKSIGMNGFCKDCTATCIFSPFLCSFLQIEVYKVHKEAIPGLLLEQGSRRSMLALARDVGWGVLGWNWVNLRAWDLRAMRELEAKPQIQWCLYAQGWGEGH